MTATDLLGEALHSLASHRLRATLSSIGVIAGVATVVAALAVANGARRQALADIGALGLDNILIRNTVSRSGSPASKGAPAITLDVRMLRARFADADVAALRTVDDAIGAADRNIPVTVAGVTPDWRITAGVLVSTGRWITASDQERGVRIAVMSPRIARRVFGGADPIGRRVFVAGEWRTVAGIIRSGAADSASRSPIPTLDLDRAVFVPMSSLDLRAGAGDRGDVVDQIVLRLPPHSDITRAASSIARLLHANGTTGFEVIVPRELLHARMRAQRSFHVVLLAVGGLALFISGVGIMNIMVASVAERAPEIGVRRAFGARRTAILMQFATEAALLSAAGGAAGVPAGISAAAAVAWIAGWPVAVSALSVAIALALAVTVGLAAGIYPARLAASVSPIDALRM